MDLTPRPLALFKERGAASLLPVYHEGMAAKPQVKIVAVGRLRERHWLDAEAEYRKRLTSYTAKLTVAEVADEPTPDDASLAQEETIRQKEGERLLTHIGPRDYVIALDRSGRSFDSPGFAAHLDRITAEEGASTLTFIIGGSLGLNAPVLDRADLILSFGAFTYPHQLMRVILLEQFYRAAKIQRGEPYHK
jgi:23S rRNA (pseudouridine1915-N3)-methyltransferase